jgi:hypothetical protein
VGRPWRRIDKEPAVGLSPLHYGWHPVSLGVPRHRDGWALQHYPGPDLMYGATQKNVGSTSTNDFNEENPCVERGADEGQHGAGKDPVQATPRAGKQAAAASDEGKRGEQEHRKVAERPDEWISLTPLPHRNPDGLYRDDGTGCQDLHAESSIGLTGHQAEIAHHQDTQQRPECRGRSSGQVAVLKDEFEVD